MGRATIDSLTTGERAARSSRHRARVVCVSIIKTAARTDDAGVADHRIANVDSINVSKAPVIPGVERFAKTQREPADAETSTKSEAEASAEETDERRTID